MLDNYDDYDTSTETDDTTDTYTCDDRDFAYTTETETTDIVDDFDSSTHRVESTVDSSEEVDKTHYESWMDHTPRYDSPRGAWEGMRADSKFVPSENEQEVNELLEQYGTDGVEYHKGEPQFEPFTRHEINGREYECSTKIGHMIPYRNTVKDEYDEGRCANGDRYDTAKYLGNFEQADLSLAEKINSEKAAELGLDNVSDLPDTEKMSPYDIYNYRKEHTLTWHERKDLETMDLVPTKINSFFGHSGGVSESNDIYEITSEWEKEHGDEPFA